MTQYRNIVRSRKLAERSYLYFKYPFKGKSLEFYLPFMENIEVSESQRPNYATYDLIGRSSSLFAYLGSKSREMNLKFNFTLPNIIDYIHNVGLSEMFSNNFRELITKADRSEEKRKFFKNPGIAIDHPNHFDYYGNAVADIRQIDESFRDASEKSAVRGLFAGVAEFLDWSKSGGLFGLFDNAANRPPKGYSDVDMKGAINYLMLWVNVIRTSVINNSTNTQYGPPTIYLNHGTMYNNIPCVCTNYSIKINNNVGYDLLSLAPRQVEVTMNLSENRTGNFNKFNPFHLTDGDGLTGWESIITKDEYSDKMGTMDPNNQFLRFFRRDTGELELIESIFDQIPIPEKP